MSDDTPINGWSLDALYKAIDARITEQARTSDLRVEELVRTFDQRITNLWERTSDGFESSSIATNTALAGAEKAVNAALVASEKAVLKAEALATQRSEQQNEWRQTVSDLVTTMMPRAEYQSIHAELVRRIDVLESLTSAETGRKAGVTTQTGLFIATSGLGLGIISTFVILIVHFFG